MGHRMYYAPLRKVFFCLLVGLVGPTIVSLLEPLVRARIHSFILNFSPTLLEWARTVQVLHLSISNPHYSQNNRLTNGTDACRFNFHSYTVTTDAPTYISYRIVNFSANVYSTRQRQRRFKVLFSIVYSTKYAIHYSTHPTDGRIIQVFLSCRV